MTVNDVDNEKNDFALVRKQSSAVEKTAPGAKRVLSDMVADALVLAKKERAALATAKFRIGEHELYEPDYRQILIWATALELKPEEVIKHLRNGLKFCDDFWIETQVSEGRLRKINLDFQVLPLKNPDLIEGLNITHLSFFPVWQWPEKSILNLPLPELTHLSCRNTEEGGLAQLYLSRTPKLVYLDCSNWACHERTDTEFV